MNGWVMVGAIVALFVLVTIGLNARLWCRHKALVAIRPAWDGEAFLAVMKNEGVDCEISTVVFAEFRPFYMAGMLPHPDDDIKHMLRIDPDDLVDIVEAIVESLGQPMPESASPEYSPVFQTVGDVARWVNKRSRRFAAVNRIRSLTRVLPADYRFDREEANAR